MTPSEAQFTMAELAGIDRRERLKVTAADGTTHRFYTHDEVQAAIAEAMMGAAADQDKTANWWSQEVDRRAAKGKGLTCEVAMAGGRLAGHSAAAAAIRASIPTDAMAALDAVKAQVRDEACEIIEKHFAGSIYASNRTKTLAAIRAMKGGE